MPQSSKLPGHSGKPSAAMTCSDESKTPVRRPDSPRPHFSGLPDTRINLLTGCEYVDDKTTGSWDHRSLRREESIKASTKLSSRLSRSGGYSENCNFLKTDARQIADDIGRCAQTLAEAKFNLDRANRAARTIWTMNSLKKSIEPLCKGTTAAAAGVASGADNDSPRKKVNNRNWRSASTSSIAPSFNGHHPHVLFSDSEEEQGRQVPGDFEKNHVGNLSKWKFNINVPMHTRAFGDSADHANSCKKETTGYTASDISCINDSTRANLPGDAGSIQKLNPTGSCDLLFGSTAAGGVQNGYKQPANYPEQSPFDELVQHIEYQSPHSNPRNEKSFRMSTPLRPSIDPLQRPSRRPCILSSDSTLPQNRSSLPHNPTPFTLPRDPSSRPTLTSSTNSINRKPIHKPASPRPILSSQCPKLSQVHNWNLSSTLPQASSSRTKFSSHTISPVANLNITIMYGPDPTTPIVQHHEVRPPRIVSPPDPSARSARRALIHRHCLQYRIHRHCLQYRIRRQKLREIPLFEWSNFECRRWIFKFLIMEQSYEPKAAFRQSQKFHGSGSNLYQMRFSDWTLMIGQYFIAFEIRMRLFRNTEFEHIASGPQHEPDLDP